MKTAALKALIKLDSKDAASHVVEGRKLDENQLEIGELK